MTEMTDAEFSDSECLRGSAEMHMAEARRVDESDHPLADMIAKAHRMRADRLEALATKLDTHVLVPTGVVRFLLGEAPHPDTGLVFGDTQADERGKYWWRKELRAMLQAQEADDE